MQSPEISDSDKTEKVAINGGLSTNSADLQALKNDPEAIRLVFSIGKLDVHTVNIFNALDCAGIFFIFYF